MNQESTEKTSADKTPVITWVSHPARSKPVASLLVSILIVVIAIGIYSWTKSPVFTALCTIVFIGSLSGFFFPTRYSLYEDHLVVKYTITSLSKEWKQYRSFYKDRNGVLLSPFATRSRLENFRGVYLRFGDFDRDTVLAFIESRIKGASGGS